MCIGFQGSAASARLMDGNLTAAGADDVFSLFCFGFVHAQEWFRRAQ